MRPISWLHVSDLHLRTESVWSQDVVLSALLQHLKEACAGTRTFAFALVTGDIAFSGNADEYSLAEDFFTALESATSIERDYIFCVPGNHDVDRTRQKLSFHGARQSLKSVADTDDLLSGGEDLQTLLLRQERYRHFQDSFFARQNRLQTPDGLGYVVRVTVDDISFAILGLNSAWLADGGSGDHHNLLLGERQVLNATALASQGEPPPHIVIGIAHHPIRLLKDFEYGPLQNLFAKELHFFHCGHLHEPGTTVTGILGNNCLTIAAGAAFASRQFRNAYSAVTLDMELGQAKIEVFRYDPAGHKFVLAETEDHPVQVSTAGTCDFSELKSAIESYCDEASPLANYFAALLLGLKAEVPIPIDGHHLFASPDTIEDSSGGQLLDQTRQFLSLRNILNALYGRLPLDGILKDHGIRLDRYFKALQEACKTEPDLWPRLLGYDADARRLASGPVRHKKSYSAELFKELTRDGEWSLLREQTERQLGVKATLNGETATLRYYGMALARSPDQPDKDKAIRVYRELTRRAAAEHTDFGNLALLLLAQGAVEDAKQVVVLGLQDFPTRTAYFVEIGHAIVRESGDRQFRDLLNRSLGANA